MTQVAASGTISPALSKQPFKRELSPIPSEINCSPSPIRMPKLAIYGNVTPTPGLSERSRKPKLSDKLLKSDSFYGASDFNHTKVGTSFTGGLHDLANVLNSATSKQQSGQMMIKPKKQSVTLAHAKRANL